MYIINGIVNPKRTYDIFKVKYGSILVGYYKSHGVGIRVI